MNSVYVLYKEYENNEKTETFIFDTEEKALAYKSYPLIDDNINYYIVKQEINPIYISKNYVYMNTSILSHENTAYRPVFIEKDKTDISLNTFLISKWHFPCYCDFTVKICCELNGTAPRDMQKLILKRLSEIVKAKEYLNKPQISLYSN